jgi:predicted amidohydrolase
MSQQGVETLFIISNSPARGAFENRLYSQDFWETTIKYIANNLTMNVIFVNRVGVEDGITFWGGSCVYNAIGDKIIQLPLIEEDEHTVVLDKEIIRRARLNSPFYRDENLFVIRNFFENNGDIK